MANYRKGPEYIIDESGCWVWQGGIISSGYGLTTDNGARKLAHRYYYEKYKGPIPNDLELDHLCRNKKCVNPDHLEPVTRAINTRRGLATKLTDEEVIKIRELRGKVSQRELAKQFGVCHTTIGNIQRFIKWTGMTI